MMAVRASPLTSRAHLTGRPAVAASSAAPLAPVPRRGGASRSLRSLVVRAKAEPALKAKVGPGSIVPWADASVQRMFQLGTEPINWETGAKVLARQTKDTKGIIAFARAEVEAKGAEALAKEAMNMPMYAVTRSLFIEVWLAIAAARAGLTDPTSRRALGLVYSATNVDSEKNAFTVFADALGPALRDPAAGVAGILDALVADVKGVAAGLTDEDRAKVKQNSKTGYDSSVTEATLKAIASASGDAVASLPAALPPLTVVPLLMPALRDPGKEGAKKEAAAPAAAAAAKPKAGGFGGFGAKIAEARQKLPDFASMLKKQQRPGFVELGSWAIAEDKVTGSEAVGLLIDFTLKAREKVGKPLLLLVPGEFMAATITLGTRRLAGDVRVVAVGEALPVVPQGTVAVVAAFTPAPNDGPLDGPAGMEAVGAIKKAGLPMIVAAVTRVPSAEAAVDAKERSAAVEKVSSAAWAKAAK